MMAGNGLPTTQPDGCAFFPPCHQLDSALEAAVMHRTFYLEMDILNLRREGPLLLTSVGLASLERLPEK